MLFLIYIYINFVLFYRKLVFFTILFEVADKGLNCEENIVRALASKNGYLFSKTIKTMFPYRENDQKKKEGRALRDDP